MVTTPSLSCQVVTHSCHAHPDMQESAVNCNFLLAQILFDSFTLPRHLRHARMRLGSLHKLTRRGMCKCHNLSLVSAVTQIRNIRPMTIVFSDSAKMKTSKLVMIECKSVILPPCWWVAVRGVRSQMLGGQCCEGMSPGQLLLPINLGCSQQSSLPQLGSDSGDEDEECHLVSR